MCIYLCSNNTHVDKSISVSFKIFAVCCLYHARSSTKFNNTFRNLDKTKRNILQYDNDYTDL